MDYSLLPVAYNITQIIERQSNKVYRQEKQLLNKVSELKSSIADFQEEQLLLNSFNE